MRTCAAELGDDGVQVGERPVVAAVDGGGGRRGRRVEEGPILPLVRRRRLVPVQQVPQAFSHVGHESSLATCRSSSSHAVELDVAQPQDGRETDRLR